MAEDDEAFFITIRKVSNSLFGNNSNASMRRVRSLIDNGHLQGRQLGTLKGSPWWVVRSSFERFLEKSEAP